MPAHPQVTKYLSATEFLADVYRARKQEEPDFSYQSWAQELRIKNRSFLRLIVTGQRPITATTRDLFVKGLGLKGFEKDYFETLIAYNQSSDPEKKDSLQARLFAILRVSQDRVEIADTAEFLANPALPVLQVLLSFRDVRKTPEALAPLFKSTPAEVKEWLETLGRLGLAEKSNDHAEWSAAHANFKVPDSLGLLPLQRYNAESLRRAAQAVHLPPSQRRFRSLLIPLSEADYTSFLLELNELATRLLSRYNPSELADRRLYEFTTALVPALPAEPRVQMNSIAPPATQKAVSS